MPLSEIALDCSLTIRTQTVQDRGRVHTGIRCQGLGTIGNLLSCLSLQSFSFQGQTDCVKYLLCFASNRVVIPDDSQYKLSKQQMDLLIDKLRDE